MNCERASEQMVDRWRDVLGPADERELEAHLESCAECRAEAAGLGATWSELGAAPAAEVPSDRMRARFYTALAAYEQAGESVAARSETPWRDLLRSLAALWPSRPALQMGLAAASLVAGIFLGGLVWGGAGGGSREVDALRAEMNTMSRTVGLALLEHHSASERLRGVSWSARSLGDEEIVGALLDTVSRDASVNVRLAAVDALAGLAGRPVVRKQLVKTAEAAGSPLLQAAILRLLIADDDNSNEVRQLLRSEAIDPVVKERTLDATAVENEV